MYFPQNLNNKCTFFTTYLWFNVKYCHQALAVNAADRVQLSTVHSFLMSAVLKVFILCNVLHHLFVRDKEVAATVLLVPPRGSRRVYTHEHVSK